jgi:hypothetical protein
MPFVWVIRTWCSLDTFWEAIRSSKDYDAAYSKPELVIEEIQKIILREQKEWKDLCESSEEFEEDQKEFLVEIPTLEQIKNRPFYKFLSITNSTSKKDEFVQNWYIERLKYQQVA